MSHLEEGRGRQPVVSTGRGGAGNLIRSPSRGVDPEVVPGVERGREARDASIDRVTHSGRGGAGNIRSPSRGGVKETAAAAREDALQDRLIAENRGRQAEQAFSTGRGGVGNISRSKSRSRSAVRDATATKENGSANGHAAHPMHASGRGGFGNISEEKRDSLEEEKRAAAEKYEKEVAQKHRLGEVGKPHSTGKGGSGNMTTATPDMGSLSLEEREAHAKVHAHDKEHGVMSGRGGGGNFHKDRSPSQKDHSPADGERGRHHGGVLGSVFRSLSKAAGRDKSVEGAKGETKA